MLRQLRRDGVGVDATQVASPRHAGRGRDLVGAELLRAAHADRLDARRAARKPRPRGLGQRPTAAEPRREAAGEHEHGGRQARARAGLGAARLLDVGRRVHGPRRARRLRSA